VVEVMEMAPQTAVLAVTVAMITIMVVAVLAGRASAALQLWLTAVSAERRAAEARMRSSAARSARVDGL
jgi:hypothetical protein